jgi:hypothetical protein
VDSILIEGVWYNRETRVLHVLFTSGSYYIYFDVSYYRYLKWIKADSKGRYFNKHIKWGYMYRRVK